MAVTRDSDPRASEVSRSAGAPMLDRRCDIRVIGSAASGISAARQVASASREMLPLDGPLCVSGGAVNSILGMLRGLVAPGADGRRLTHDIESGTTFACERTGLAGG
jgi:hypothetical protein